MGRVSSARSAYPNTKIGKTGVGGSECDRERKTKEPVPGAPPPPTGQSICTVSSSALGAVGGSILRRLPA